MVDMNEGIKMRCQNLDDNGKQCKNKAYRVIKYHGDNEVFYDTITWVKVYLCKKCFEKVEYLYKDGR